MIIPSLLDCALHFVSVKHLEISSAALDFWYKLISCYLGINGFTDEDDDYFLPAAVILANHYSREKLNNGGSSISSDDDVDAG
jgi:hypothetical protein